MNLAKLKCAVEMVKLALEFQRYKHEHPLTKKLPSDPLFAHKHEKLTDVRGELTGMHTGGKMQDWVDNPDSITAPEEVSVVRQNGKVVGWSGVGTIRQGRSWKPALSVFVDKSSRGHGVGQKVVTEALKKANPEDTIYFDPEAPQLGKWIEAAGYDAEPIPQEAFD